VTEPDQAPGRLFGRLRSLTRRIGALPSGLREDELHYWRERILFALLLSGVSFAPFALVPGVMLLVRRGLWELIVLDAGVYAAALVLFFSRRLAYEVRALGACLLTYIIGLGVIHFLGPLSGGPAWLFAFPIMAGVLLGPWAAMAALGVNVATLAWIGWLISLGHFVDGQPLLDPLPRGVGAGTNFLFLNAVTAISVSVLVRGLEAMLGRQRTAAAALEQERARLELINRRLEKEIEERQRAEIQLKAALQEKEVLLREIHHRVKNNMQIVSSLLNLQTRGLKDEQVQGVLRESQGRIQALALVHEALYRSETLAVVDFREYLKKLTDNIFRAYAFPGGRIRKEVDVESLPLDIDRAVACGLAINELITNSLRHAFPAGRPGRIVLSARLISPEEMELKASDDGVGLPQGFDWRRAETLGLQIVVALIEEQLGGSVSLSQEQGAAFHLRFRHKTAS